MIYYLIMEKNIIDELRSKSPEEIIFVLMMFISDILSMKNYGNENNYFIVVAYFYHISKYVLNS